MRIIGLAAGGNIETERSQFIQKTSVVEFEYFLKNIPAGIAIQNDVVNIRWVLAFDEVQLADVRVRLQLLRQNWNDLAGEDHQLEYGKDQEESGNDI